MRRPVGLLDDCLARWHGHVSFRKAPTIQAPTDTGRGGDSKVERAQGHLRVSQRFSQRRWGGCCRLVGGREHRNASRPREFRCCKAVFGEILNSCVLFLQKALLSVFGAITVAVTEAALYWIWQWRYGRALQTTHKKAARRKKVEISSEADSKTEDTSATSAATGIEQPDDSLRRRHVQAHADGRDNTEGN